MKNQLTLLFLFLNISLFGQTELNLDWERVTDIPGNIPAITKLNDTLFTYTNDGIFWSTDVGQTWTLGYFDPNLGSHVVSFSKSQIAISKTIKSSSYGTSIQGRSNNHTVSIYKGSQVINTVYEHYTYSGFAETSAATESVNKILAFVPEDDNSYILLTKFWLGGIGKNGHTESSKTRLIFTENEGKNKIDTIIAQFNPNIGSIGKWQFQFLKGQLNQYFVTFFKNKFELFDKESYKSYKMIDSPVSEKDIIKTIVRKNKIFVVTKKNVYYRDADDTQWSEINLTVDSIQQFLIRDDLFIVKTSSQDVYSSDLDNFSPFIFDTISKPNNYYVFGDTIIGTTGHQLIRSFDKGQTWDEISPLGIYSTSVPTNIPSEGAIIPEELPDFTYNHPSNNLAVRDYTVEGDTVLASFFPKKARYVDSLLIYYSIDRGMTWKQKQCPQCHYDTKIFSRNGIFYMVYNTVTKYTDVTQNGNVIFDTQEFSRPEIFLSTNYDFIFHYLNFDDNFYIVKNNHIIKSANLPTYAEVKHYETSGPIDFFLKFSTNIVPKFSYIKEIDNILYIYSTINGLWKSSLDYCDEETIVGATCDDGDSSTLASYIDKNCECVGVDTAQFCRKNDSIALRKLYLSSYGAQWKNNTNWLSNKPLNEWYGVHTNQNGCVVSLDLDGVDDNGLEYAENGNNLSNLLPKEISNLKFLQKIYLSNNKSLSGELPADFYNLAMTDISLSNTRIRGSLINILKFDNIKTVDLFRFNTKDTLTQDHFKIPTLEYLNIGGKYGQIFPNAAGLPNLKYLNLSSTNKKGNLPDVSGFTHLEELYLNDNDYAGCFPTSYKDLCGIKVDLSNNKKLSWEGDFERYCSEDSQIGAPCDDGYPESTNDQINEQCNCIGTFPEYCRTEDSTLLAEIYYALDGDNWTNNENWLTDAPLNKWYGVTGKPNNCISKVSLRNNNLSGCIPEIVIERDDISYNFWDNPKLPFSGFLNQIKMGADQIGAPCNDKNPDTYGDRIDADCQCHGKPIIEYCRERDSTALAAFYKKANGDKWIHNDNWLSTAPLSEWYGVQTNDNGCVIGIDLDGKVDFSMTNDGNGNKLKNTIEIKDLPDLRYLDISNNKFIDKVTIDKKIYIDSISLANCNLKNGAITFQEDQLPRYIDMSGNNLSNLSFLSKGKYHINFLNLENNSITQFFTYGYPNLQYLNLKNNLIKDPINFNKIAKIKYINLSNNLLEIIHWDDLNELKYLQAIYAANNKFSGCIQDSIPNICSLGYSEDDTKSGYNFDNNGQLPWKGDIRNLCMGEQQIGAPCDNGKYEYDQVITENCECKGKDAGVRDDSLALVALYNATKGFAWTNNNNWLSKEPIENWFGVELNAQRRVVYISLPNNNLDGVIPPEIKKLRFLKILILSNNLLQGTLTPEIFEIDQLLMLVLTNNLFSGTIPSKIGAAQNLRELYLSHNNLGGKLPTAFRSMPKLREIDLSKNHFDGGIENFDKTKFIRLNINDNNFSGQLPEFIFQYVLNVPKLGNSRANLSDNNFSGCYPDIYQWASRYPWMKTNNNPLLPWKGDISKLANNNQIGAPCDDGNPETIIDAIDVNCNCSEKIVENDDLKNISLFKLTPNPNDGLFNLDIEFRQPSKTVIKIYSPLGIKVFVKKINSKTYSQRIDLSEYGSGIYFIEMATSEGSLTRKIVVE